MYRQLLLSCISLHLFLSSSAFVPSPCASNVSSTPSVCCPTPTGHRNPCGYPARGRCHIAVSVRAPRIKGFPSRDIRMDWPLRVFQYTCKCADKYWGVACEECRPGYEGKHCQYKQHLVRRNFKSYNRLEQRRFIQVLTAAHSVPSGYVKPTSSDMTEFKRTSVYENLVYVHYFAGYSESDPSKCTSINLNHNTKTFILWHRYFTLWVERQMRDIARYRFGWKNFTFPYWDFTGQDSCDVCSGDYMCGISKRKDGRFPSSCKISRWEVFYPKGIICDSGSPKHNKIGIRRKLIMTKLPGVNTRLPSQKEITNLLRAPFFNVKDTCSCLGFAYYMENGCDKCNSRGLQQMHNMVHNIFPPNLQNPITAPNDPLFFLIHSQIDRILQRWFLNAKPSYTDIFEVTEKPQICRWCNLVGFLPTVNGPEMLIDLSRVGIYYDNLSLGNLSEKTHVPLATSYESMVYHLCSRWHQVGPWSHTC